MKKDHLDLTNPIGISGQFLQNPEAFQEIQEMWLGYGKLSQELRAVEIDLRRCNDPVWLRTYERRCRRLNRDPRHELPALVARLECHKNQIEASLKEIRERMAELEPSTQESLATETLTLPAGTARRGRMQVDGVVERNALIDAHLDEPDVAICKLLDDQFPKTDRPAPQLPDSWARDHSVTSFSEALVTIPHLVHELISKRRRLHRTRQFK